MLSHCAYTCLQNVPLLNLVDCVIYPLSTISTTQHSIFTIFAPRFRLNIQQLHEMVNKFKAHCILYTLPYSILFPVISSVKKHEMRNSCG